MKTFSDLREAKSYGRPVFNKRIGKIKMTIVKELKGFCVYIDGDKLDVYRTKREAEKAGTTFIKQYKGSK
tara:strand:- start:35 stop:244 length:210 start_codon:yes stop_codon:yes gene_type:complete